MNDFEFRTHLRTSEIEKNNFSNMQLLKSIYDDSFDAANEFFSEGFKSSAAKAAEKSKENAKKSAKEVKKANNKYK